MQSESHLGIDAQKQSCRDYVKRNNGRIVKWYLDEGVSGTKPVEQRPGLNQLMQDLKPNEVILVAKRDRLARDTFLNLWIEKEVQKVHAVIESADGTGNGSSPADEMMRHLLSIFASYEKNLLSERTTVAMSKLTRKVGRLPYGWKWDAQGRQIKDKTQYPTVERILELRKDGVGYRTIAKLLDKENRPTQRGGKWNPTSVMRICGRLEGKRMSKWMQREQESTNKELNGWEKE
jgi:DNA invertase Pin-like site-specific DNA recombinase